MKTSENVLVKSKMSGYEVGRVMIQSFLYELKQLYEGAKDIKDLLTPQEVQHIQDQLTDINDMKIYNSCRRMWEYMALASCQATIIKKEIDSIALKLYIIISGEMRAEGHTKPENTKEIMALDLFNDLIDQLKKWLVLREVFKLISERMEMPDIMILVVETPMSRIGQVNAIINDLQFLYPESKISRALADKGIGHICADDEIPKNTDVIKIQELTPSDVKITAAREAIKDLTYFRSNWGIHSILEEGTRR